MRCSVLGATDMNETIVEVLIMIAASIGCLLFAEFGKGTICSYAYLELYEFCSLVFSYADNSAFGWV